MFSAAGRESISWKTVNALKTDIVLTIELSQNLLNRFARIFVCGNRPPDHEIIGAGLDCLARSHDAFLISVLRPAWPHSRNNQFDFIAKLRAQESHFERTGNEAINAGCNAQIAKSQYVPIELLFNSDLIQRVLRRAGQDGHAQDSDLVALCRDGGSDHIRSTGQMNRQHLDTEL